MGLAQSHHSHRVPHEDGQLCPVGMDHTGEDCSLSKRHLQHPRFLRVGPAEMLPRAEDPQCKGRPAGAEEGRAHPFRTWPAYSRWGRQGDYRILPGGREDSGASVHCVARAPVLGPST